jgi:hypothetical protein
MLKMGGARVTLAGFRRSAQKRAEIEGAALYDLGRTHDAKLWARAAKVGQTALLQLGSIVDQLKCADIVIARNLEMLALARAAMARLGAGVKRPRLVYECLDVHRAMVGQTLKSRALRAFERALLKDIDLLLVSSPGFMRCYFEPMQRFKGAWLLVENKLLVEDAAALPEIQAKPPSPPWRIGWFGVLRCQKSLDMLEALAKSANGEIEIILRGRPAYHAFRDFNAQVKHAGPHLQFQGPYQTHELAQIYADVHFAWAVDYFDEGANSDWLLPNRLYEAGAHGVGLIARAQTEMGNRVKICADGGAHEIMQRFAGVLDERLLVSSGGAASAFIHVRADCQAMVEQIVIGVVRGRVDEAAQRIL